MEDRKPQYTEALLVFKIIWIIVLVSQFLLLLMTYFVIPDVISGNGTENQFVSYVLSGIAATALFASFIIRTVLISFAKKQRTFWLILLAAFLGITICEAVTLLGLMSAFVTRFPYFYIFIIVGIAGTVLHFPSRSTLDSTVDSENKGV